MSESNKEDAYTEAETDARREAALKRMLNTPQKPHAQMVKHKPVGKPGRDA
jgi:hypothetical protein